MFSMLSNITSSLYSAYNNTNTTQIVESARNLASTVAKEVFEANQFQINASTPSLENQTLEVISVKTTEFLEKTEIGQQIATVTTNAKTKSGQLQKEAAKILHQLVLFKKSIHGAWQSIETNALVLYKKASARIENPSIIIDDVKYGAEVAKNTSEYVGGVAYNKTAELGNSAAKKLQGYFGITEGTCYAQSSNSTIVDGCVIPLFDCGLHATITKDKFLCCNFTECSPAIYRATGPAWEEIKKSMKQTTLSSLFVVGQTGLSSLFNAYPYLNVTALPEQTKSSVKSIATSLSIITASAVSFFALPAFGLTQKQLTRSLPAGAAIGAAASVLWGQNPILGALKGSTAQMAIDTLTFFPLENLYLKYLSNPGLQERVNSFGNGLPLALTSMAAVGLFTVQYVGEAAELFQYNAANTVFTPAFLSLFPVTILYGLSSWSRSAIKTVAPHALLPVVAYLSLATLPTPSSDDLPSSPYFYTGIGPLLATGTALLAYQYRRLFWR